MWHGGHHVTGPHFLSILWPQMQVLAGKPTISNFRPLPSLTEELSPCEDCVTSLLMEKLPRDMGSHHVTAPSQWSLCCCPQLSVVPLFVEDVTAWRRCYVHVTAPSQWSFCCCPQLSVVPLFVEDVTAWRRCYVACRLLTIQHCFLLTNQLCPLMTVDGPIKSR